MGFDDVHMFHRMRVAAGIAQRLDEGFVGHDVVQLRALAARRLERVFRLHRDGQSAKGAASHPACIQAWILLRSRRS